VPKQYTPNSVNITSWPIIGAANMAEHSLLKTLTLFKFLLYVTTNVLVGAVTVAPIYWWKRVSSTNRQGIANR